MRGLTVTALLLWTAAEVAAQPHDPGVDDGSASAAVVDGGVPALDDPIGRQRAQNDALQARIAELDGLSAALDGLADDVFRPPETLAQYLDVDAADVLAVARRIDRLDHEIGQVQLDLAHLETVHSALVAQWSAGGDAGALDAERLNNARLERDKTAAELRWAQAMRRYLTHTQAARSEADTARDAHDRAEADSAREAEEKRRGHAEARDQAIADQENAETEADKILASEDARLELVGEEQAAYQQSLIKDRAMTSKLLTLSKQFRVELERSAYDDQYDAVALRLRRVRLSALEDTFALFSRPRVPQPGDRLGESVRALPSSFDGRVAALEAKRLSLEAAATALRVEAQQVLADRAALFVREADDLNALQVGLLNMVSASKRRQLTGITSEATVALRGEATQVAVDLSYWAYTRWEQLRHFRKISDNWSEVWSFTVRLFEIGLLLLILQFVVRRWDVWMLGLVVAVGGSMAAGGSSLYMARVADSARSFGPSMLAFGAAVLAYGRLGGASAPPEIQVVYIFVFWMTLLRFQLRVAERVAAALRTGAAEKARVIAEEEREAADVDSDPDAAASNHNAEIDKAVATDNEPEAAATLFSKTWRVGTAYVAVIVIMRSLAELAVGRGVFHAVLTRFALWGAIPLGIYFLRAWRPRIVHEYVRWSPKAGALTELAEAHSHRFYGVFIVALVFVVVVVRRVARFIKDHLMNLQWIKAIKEFWTRSRVDKHGRYGRVLENPPDLPPEIIAQFPIGPVGPEDRPIKTAPLESIKQLFESWKIDKSDGSVVLVGATGTGKSTLLAQLEEELGEPVMRGELLTKVTRTESLAHTLARILGLSGDSISTERELVSALYDEKRRVIAVDNCHNLFLRKVGGFEAWEAFTRVVNETCDNVFWVLAFNDASWEYLNDVAERVAYFRRIIPMPEWSDEQLRRLVLTRMRRAKYRPNFTDLLVTKLEGVKTSTQIIRTSKGYFRLLWDFTDGNPGLASHFWMRSLVPDEATRRARVHLFAAPKVEDLQKLPDELAFVLASVVEHENITPAELAETSNMSTEFCRFALRLCRERGYLWRSSTTGRMVISLRWQKTIVRYLKRKGFLYS